MKTKTINLYEFDELDEEIKAKVIEKNRDINVDYGWYKWTLEEWEERLEEMGFANPEISFSGFASQGDGASFTCKSVDVEKFLTVQKKRGVFKNLLEEMKEGTIEISVEIVRIDHYYSHENTVRVESELLHYEDETPEKYIDLERKEGELRKLVNEIAKDLMRKIYKDLEQEYEYLASDKQVIETIKANEYTFTSSGRMENL